MLRDTVILAECGAMVVIHVQCRKYHARVFRSVRYGWKEGGREGEREGGI